VLVYLEATLCVRARRVTRNWIFEKKRNAFRGKVDYRLCCLAMAYRKSSFDGGKWGINDVAEICEYISNFRQDLGFVSIDEENFYHDEIW